MATYLLAILGLGVLCAAWVALELWLRRIDPEGAKRNDRCGHCGGCAGGPPKADEPQRPLTGA